MCHIVAMPIYFKAASKTARWLMHTDTAKEHDSKEGRTSEDAAAKRSSLEASHLSDQELSAITTLEREVSIMAAIRHPNVVMFMGLCLRPVCIVTEFCARGSLSDVISKAASNHAFGQQLDWPRRLGMALDAAKGMLQLHNHKPAILHRDLKSPNLLVDKHWRIKVTDFNLSSMLYSSSHPRSFNSSVANNPRWLAPEVVAYQQYSKAADVYSFGIILWELLTWQVPWGDLNPFQIMLLLTQQHTRPEIPSAGSLPGPAYPNMEDYILLMQSCWREEPKSRPGFEHIIVDLRALLLRLAAMPRQRSLASTDMRTQISAETLPDSPGRHIAQSVQQASAVFSQAPAVKHSQSTSLVAVESGSDSPNEHEEVRQSAALSHAADSNKIEGSSGAGHSHDALQSRAGHSQGAHSHPTQASRHAPGLSAQKVTEAESADMGTAQRKQPVRNRSSDLSLQSASMRSPFDTDRAAAAPQSASVRSPFDADHAAAVLQSPFAAVGKAMTRRSPFDRAPSPPAVSTRPEERPNSSHNKTPSPSTVNACPEDKSDLSLSRPAAADSRSSKQGDRSSDTSPLQHRLIPSDRSYTTLPESSLSEVFHSGVLKAEPPPLSHSKQ